MARIVKLILLALQVALCGGAASGALACSACTSTTLATLGAFFYGVVAAAALIRWDGVANFFIRGAVCFHAVAVLVNAKFGLHCGVCYASAGVAAALLMATFFEQPRNIWRFALEALPLAAVASLAWTIFFGLPEPPRGSRDGAVQLLVYEKRGCPYCKQFRAEILPDLGKVPVTFVEEERAPCPPICAYPTIVVLRDGAPVRVFEGVPEARQIREAMR